jgi:hypothetical protein
MTEVDQKKYLTWGGIAVLGGLLVYFLTKKPDTGGGYTDPTGNDGSGGSNSGEIVTPFNAANTANNLFELMDGYGTKEDEIIAELTNITPSQFLQVFLKFGKKNYYLFGSNSVFGTPQNLKYWLQEELGVTSNYYRTLKLKYPNLL